MQIYITREVIVDKDREMATLKDNCKSLGHQLMETRQLINQNTIDMKNDDSTNSLVQHDHSSSCSHSHADEKVSDAHEERISDAVVENCSETQKETGILTSNDLEKIHVSLYLFYNDNDNIPLRGINKIDFE